MPVQKKSGNLLNAPRTLLERRMKDNLIETFKMINGIFDYGSSIFWLFLLQLDMYRGERKI